LLCKIDTPLLAAGSFILIVILFKQLFCKIVTIIKLKAILNLFSAFLGYQKRTKYPLNEK